MSVVHDSVAEAILRLASPRSTLATMIDDQDFKSVSGDEEVLGDEEDSDEEVDFAKEEDLEDYHEGGYHPCDVADVCGDRNQYSVIRKLGWGHFSTVWLAHDSETKQYVALKIIKSAEKYRVAAVDEIKILKKVAAGLDSHPGKSHVVKLLDYFLLKGPNGDHVCMVFELLGENMLNLLYKFRDLYGQYKDLSSGEPSLWNLNSSSDLASSNANSSLDTLEAIFKDYYGGLPISLVKRISKQVLLALDYMHRECGVVHTDLKPENILVEIKNVDRVVDLVRKEEDALRRERKSMSRLRKDSIVSINSASTNYSGMSASASYSATNKKKLSINTQVGNGTQEQLTPKRGFFKNCTPIRCSKPLPLPILRKSSVYSFCYGESDSPSSSKSPISYTVSSSNLFKKFTFHEPAEGEDLCPKFDNLSVCDNPSNLSKQFEKLKDEPAVTLEDELEELDENIIVKIADLGNACYVDHHFTDAIQTREYRSPEVIIQAQWGCSADIWSAGCVIFELITGQFAFKPASRHSSFERDCDHMARIIGTVLDEKHYKSQKACYDFYDKWFFDEESNFVDRPLDSIPKPAPKGFNLQKILKTKLKDFYNTKGNRCGPFIFPYEVFTHSKLGKHMFDLVVHHVRNTSKIRFKSMHRVLNEKYHISKKESREIHEFLLRMLEMHPRYREDAGALTNHPWLVVQGHESSDVEIVIDRQLGSRGQDINGWYYEAGKDGDSSDEDNYDYYCR